jgi:DNA-directed RNA polymerase specialized sigma24 family protein
MRYFEDLSENQVADVLGCSVGTVKSTASRALERLRHEVKSDHADGEFDLEVASETTGGSKE